MPLISVVVPIYNVEPYLEDCLDSIARQTLDDLEVIMVDDGSTDRSGEIARGFAERDPRFRLIEQPNAGLSAARNTGADAAGGEFLAFVDSDDLLPLAAYELLVTPLRKTGSDFATGNVHRLTPTGIGPTRFLARAFEATRLKTHVTRFRPLLADRIVPNKLWRRSFWQDHGYRFPEGRLHEDIPVVLPAQFAARSVDVVAEPVYLYRIREGADLSITQRRLEKRALLDRVQAVEEVQDYLARNGPRRARRWYEQSAVEQDLSYYLNVLDAADEEYRTLFLERVNAFLDRSGRGLFDELLAIDRLKWELVRRRLMPELVEVLHFQKERMADTPPVRIGRGWYGDYPFRDDPKLGIPRSVYRLNQELLLSPGVEELRFHGDELRIAGYAFIAGIGAPERDSQRVTITMLRRGRFRRLRARTAAIRLKADVRHRPEVSAELAEASVDAQWAGFEATLDPARLRALGRWRPGSWDLHVTVRAGGVTRRRTRFLTAGARPVRAVDRELGEVLVKASPAPSGELAVHVRDHWASISSHALVDRALELRGRLRAARAEGLRLQLGRPGSGPLEYPLELGGGGEFSVRIPLADLEGALKAAHPEPHDPGVVWGLWAAGHEGRVRLALAANVREAVWPLAGGELTLVRGADADAALIAREPRPLVLDASWSAAGTLELSGAVAAGAAFEELVLSNRLRIERHAFPLELDSAAAAFRVRLPLARVPSLGGELPLEEGDWELSVRRSAEPGELVGVMLSQTLDERLPLSTSVGHKSFALGSTRDQEAVVFAGRDLDDDERGRFHQRRLREGVYSPRRAEPLREAVVYLSYRGRQYSDSPRALHEELVRRQAPLEHLWVVRDGRCLVPRSASALRDGSREFHEALAAARYIVTNDRLPAWFERRPDQLCVQTLLGSPLKHLGLDVPHLRSQRWRQAEQVRKWQYVVSPSGHATPILRRAYELGDDQLVETGLPRTDLIAGQGAAARRHEARTRLGIPDGVRALLYAPTYRDHVVDRRRRHRLDLHLDVPRLRRALGDDTLILFRRHPRVHDLAPAGLRDVSDYPDAGELLLAADVLVTDYSSLAFDFALTGRPIVFFAYDLDTYEHDIRGLYLDLRTRAPGPLVRSTDELADALREPGRAQTEYAERYREFVARFCPLDDGRASARLVDRLFRG